jgi:hypothetical protein
MADRTVFVGDSAPDDLFQVTDETFENTVETVLNLTGDTIEVKYIGAQFEFSGAGTSIWPATPDPDGEHFWNCSYAFAVDDTSEADVYTIFIVVTDTDGGITTYATGDTLTVRALPVPA